MFPYKLKPEGRIKPVDSVFGLAPGDSPNRVVRHCMEQRPAARFARSWTSAILLATLLLLLAIFASSCGGGGAAGSSTSTQTAPATPTGLAAVAGNAQAALTWNASSGASSYNLYRATTKGGEGNVAYLSNIASSSYIDTGLTTGTSYFYTVAAVNSVGTSTQSTEASATPTAPIPVPQAPASLSALAGNAQIALAWTASSGAASYNIYRSTTSGGELNTAFKTGIATTAFTDTNVTNGIAYFYTVAAVNSSGVSAQSNEATATPSAGLISGVLTDAARYAPGATATISVNLTNASGATSSGNVAIQLTQMGSSVATLAAQSFSLSNGGSDTLTFTWITPSTDFQGYSVEVTATDSSSAVIGAMNSAIDVSSTWTKFPRYGYVATYPAQSTAISSQEIAQLNPFHLNGLQFYDWQWKHHVPLAGTVANPASSWTQIDNQTNYRQTVLDYIASAHSYGMAAMNYNVIYGAWAGYSSDGSGVLPQWGLYGQSNGTDQDNDNFSSIPWATPYIYVFDPSNSNWQNYIYGQEANVFAAYPFDGWHADQLGSSGFTYGGVQVNMPDAYVSFLTGAKSALKKTIVFNAAGGNGLPNVLSAEDFAYVECWPSQGQTTYNDLKAVVDSIHATNPGMGVVLPAYMDYTYAQNNTGTFNPPGVLLTDATIFASGASHLELGDGAGGNAGVDILDNEYFPNEKLTPTPPLLTALQSYYDFDVAYENVLRGGLSNNGNKISANVTASDVAAPNTVWAFARSDSNGKHMLNFINLVGETNIAWRDENADYPAPTPQSNVAVKYYYGSGSIASVLWASPDSNHGRMTSLAFTSGQDTTGAYVSFTLPSLAYWDMVYISPNPPTPSETR